MSDEEKQDQGNTGESVPGYSFGLGNETAPSTNANPSSNDDLAPNTMLPDLAPGLTHTTESAASPNSDLASAPAPAVESVPAPNPSAGVNPAPQANLSVGSNPVQSGYAATPDVDYLAPPPVHTPHVVPPAVVTSGAGQPAINASPEKFPLDEVISFSWNQMKAYFWPLTGVLTCNFILMYIPSVTSMILQHLSDSAGVALFTVLLSFVGFIIHIIINIGTINVWLKIVDGDKITVGDVYTKIDRAWDYALATFLYGAVVLLGYICLIIPGVYLQIRFQFYPYFISESKAGPLQALKASYAVTNGAVAELFFLGLICYFMNWIGALCLLLGMVPAQIIQNIAQAKAYRMLRLNTPLANMPEGLQQPLVLIPNSK